MRIFCKMLQLTYSWRRCRRLYKPSPTAIAAAAPSTTGTIQPLSPPVVASVCLAATGVVLGVACGGCVVGAGVVAVGVGVGVVVGSGVGVAVGVGVGVGVAVGVGVGVGVTSQ